MRKEEKRKRIKRRSGDNIDDITHFKATNFD